MSLDEAQLLGFDLAYARFVLSRFFFRDRSHGIEALAKVCLDRLLPLLGKLDRGVVRFDQVFYLMRR